ncbi:MAP kinase kinase (MEK) [Agyrium rufum]|nr:MAP kinase kinase (MEK) [Agyrium rufum]
MSDAFQTRTMKRKNFKGLGLSAPAQKAPDPSPGDAQIPGAIGNNVATLDTLEIGVEFQLDLRSEDLVVLKELGAGNGGTVSKVMHTATRVVMARKVIHVEAKKDVRKKIVRELHIMKDCNSPNIVSFYGSFLNETGDVIMCMEYMDCGSLDRISKDFGPVRVDVLGKIAEAVLNGLNYLYEVHRIMHRDIKPSNVVVNSRGYIKLCDFGVSGELVNSIADTFVGTSTYMAPERIQGAKYSIKSDVWSVGLTIMELAIGRFPFNTNDSSGDDEHSAGPAGILDLLQRIVHEPAPRLPKSDAFPPILDQMLQKCLVNKAEDRPTPRDLYDHDHFLQAAKRTPVNLEEWAVGMMVTHNRRSHLAPPLSPTTQALLRGDEPAKAFNNTTRNAFASSSSNDASASTSTSRTPTSGEIPIATTASNANLAGSNGTMNGGQTYEQQQHVAPPIQRVLSANADMNSLSASTSALHIHSNSMSSANPLDRPTFPPRTSSTSVVGQVPGGGGSSGIAMVGGAGGPASIGRAGNRESQQYIAQTTMPVRPAPPPGGPLPHTPGTAGMKPRRGVTPAFLGVNGEGTPI